MGQLCVCPICHPTLLTPKGTTERVGNSFRGGGKKRESGSSGLMGNNDGFPDGKQHRTVAGHVEATLPILDKTVGCPCQDHTLPNKAHTPLKLGLEKQGGALFFTHTHT